MFFGFFIIEITSGPHGTMAQREAANIVLIERKNPPFGWAIPGGFVDYGESVEEAVIREVLEETNIQAKEIRLFGVYSQPERDPRFHTVSCVYIIEPKNKDIKASSDAEKIGLFSPQDLDKIKIAFDHRRILEEYFQSEGLD